MPAQQGAGLLVWWAQRVYDRSLAEMVPAVQRPPAWVVGRPAEVRRVAALGRGGTVGDHHGGAGGGRVREEHDRADGRCDRRLLRRFRGRVYW